MVILGLGTNVGDRLNFLRRALDAIQQIPEFQVLQVSPLYSSEALLPDNAPLDWNKPYINCAIRGETSLAPLALLKSMKQIEASIGRKPLARHWGPREIDIDILAWHDHIITSDELTVPHRSLLDRPFALWPLADVAPLWMFPEENKCAAELVEKWGSRFSGDAPFKTQQINQRIDTPQLMGILNITPDSYSDGGQFVQTDRAIAHAIQLVNDGADIIDIGAESTRPNAIALTHEEEWQRLQPVLSAIRNTAFFIPPYISIDTYHPETTEKALAYDINIINDVSGLDHPRMRTIIKEAKIDCVVMHHKQIPERRDDHLPRHLDPTQAVLDWLRQRVQTLQDEGIDPENIIVDPGIGFGKLAEQSLLLLKNMAAFKSLGTRVLVGHSRKTFLSLASSLPFAERDIETLVISLFLNQVPVDMLRVHNVSFTARALRMQQGLGS
jgi:2-amino-4-hydroxy-6-hydroxymethyldihydropteridine diphosphokinase/dihydropteroate synthase